MAEHPYLLCGKYYWSCSYLDYPVLRIYQHRCTETEWYESYAELASFYQPVYLHDRKQNLLQKDRKGVHRCTD